MRWRIIILKKITNDYFNEFKEAINICCNKDINDSFFISNMEESSYSDQSKESFYSDKVLKNFINMVNIKLDNITEYRKDILKLPPKTMFTPLPAVDAVCIDADNEWYFIEFKNAVIEGKITSIKKKMMNSLWFSFYMFSLSGKGSGIVNNDVLKFSREHINYIIVAKRDKNIVESQSIMEMESIGEHYCPPKLREFINYYFKDIYMLTEYEFRNFVLHFKA